MPINLNDAGQQIDEVSCRTLMSHRRGTTSTQKNRNTGRVVLKRSDDAAISRTVTIVFSTATGIGAP